ncbi:hypothetical protein J2752_001849 [Halarchaeum rubridurum]|uniref:Uncharacterized protein n=1 Tax=Halarchaeum rubridurum TaxID=489911 RepID=A0A830G1E0_9EURY|nr:hypothetical protein [Halarchaeum rubridurum]MBP1954937.1 hypothetical protein [Halarchaeum rubridurum]GGM70222.1 hypothetical protein GCM10009017_20540 [Halarchaeum rubridurum]
MANPIVFVDILLGAFGIVPALLVLCSVALFVVLGVVSVYLGGGALADLVGGADTGYVDGQPR